jgi:hypothetical protein
MAGDANDVEVPKTSRFITFAREIIASQINTSPTIKVAVHKQERLSL